MAFDPTKYGAVAHSAQPQGGASDMPQFGSQDAPTAAPAKKGFSFDSLLNSAAKGADFVFGGGGEIGNFLGGQIAKAGYTGLNKNEQQYVDTSVNPKKLVGDIGRSGFNAATALVGAPEVRGLPLLAKLGLGAGLGTGLAGSTELSQGNTPTPGELAGGGVLGALTNSLGGKTLGKALTVTSPKQLINFALGVTKKTESQPITDAFLKRGLGGKSLEDIYNITQKEASSIEPQIQAALQAAKGAPEGVNIFLTKVARNIRNATGSKITPDVLKGRIQKFVPDFAPYLDKSSLTPEMQNDLRLAIDTNLKETTFLGKELTREQATVKKFADSLRANVKKISGTEALFKQQSEAIRIANLAEEAIKKAATSGRPGFTDIMAAGLGSAIGGATTGGLGAVPAAAAAVGLTRAVRSPRVQAGVGQLLSKSKALTPVMEAGGAITKFGLFQALKAAYDQKQ